MKMITDQPDKLVLRENTVVLSLLCFIFCLTIAPELYAAYTKGIPDSVQFVLLIVLLIALLMGGVVFARLKTITILPEAKQVNIKDYTLRGYQAQTIDFKDITGVVIETMLNEGGRTQSGRVVLQTNTKDIPLSRSFSGTQATANTLALRLRDMLGLENDDKQNNDGASSGLIEDSVLALVKSNRIVEATRMLVTAEGISLTEARAKVKKIQQAMGDLD